MLALAVATAGCTKPNPAFDQSGSTTRGEDETGKDTNEDSATSVDTSTGDGSVEGTGIATSQSGGVSTIASDELGTTDGFESGIFECPQLVDFDWTVEILDDGIPAALDCARPFLL